jgi:hypothetical protein
MQMEAERSCEKLVMYRVTQRHTLENTAPHYFLYFNREEITKSKLNELTEDKA